jgi:hypothetical protein
MRNNYLSSPRDDAPPKGSLYLDILDKHYKNSPTDSKKIPRNSYKKLSDDKRRISSAKQIITNTIPSNAPSASKPHTIVTPRQFKIDHPVKTVVNRLHKDSPQKHNLSDHSPYRREANLLSPATSDTNSPRVPPTHFNADTLQEENERLKKELQTLDRELKEKFGLDKVEVKPTPVAPKKMQSPPPQKKVEKKTETDRAEKIKNFQHRRRKKGDMDTSLETSYNESFEDSLEEIRKNLEQNEREQEAYRNRTDDESDDEQRRIKESRDRISQIRQNRLHRQQQLKHDPIEQEVLREPISPPRAVEPVKLVVSPPRLIQRPEPIMVNSSYDSEPSSPVKKDLEETLEKTKKELVEQTELLEQSEKRVRDLEIKLQESDLEKTIAQSQVKELTARVERLTNRLSNLDNDTSRKKIEKTETHYMGARDFGVKIVDGNVVVSLEGEGQLPLEQYMESLLK